jgi:fused signal recognition particle receptor
MWFGDDEDDTQANDEEGRLRGAFDSFRKNVKKMWPGSGVSGDAIDDLEAALLQSDVSLDTVEKLIEPLREDPDIEDGEQFIRDRIRSIFDEAGDQSLREAPEGPTVYFFIGVNGSGKTTTIAKLAHLLRDRGDFLFAAADTYRAAAAEQLGEWADRLGVDMISHEQGGDPSAVVYDAVEAAKSRDADYLFVDTAGRLHTRGDLLEQLRKMYDVVEDILGRGPDESLLVLDASTGQNGLNQVDTFAEELPMSGLVLTKMDSTARGGITLTVADELEVPVKLVGTGEELDDLVPFRSQIFSDAIFGQPASTG